VAALKAHNHVGALREPVNNLTLTFVAPLGAHDSYVSHKFSSLCLSGTDDG